MTNRCKINSKIIKNTEKPKKTNTKTARSVAKRTTFSYFLLRSLFFSDEFIQAQPQIAHWASEDVVSVVLDPGPDSIQSISTKMPLQIAVSVSSETASGKLVSRYLFFFFFCFIQSKYILFAETICCLSPIILRFHHSICSILLYSKRILASTTTTPTLPRRYQVNQRYQSIIVRFTVSIYKNSPRDNKFNQIAVYLCLKIDLPILLS